MTIRNVLAGIGVAHLDAAERFADPDGNRILFSQSRSRDNKATS